MHNTMALNGQEMKVLTVEFPTDCISNVVIQNILYFAVVRDSCCHLADRKAKNGNFAIMSEDLVECFFPNSALPDNINYSVRSFRKHQERVHSCSFCALQRLGLGRLPPSTSGFRSCWRLRGPWGPGLWP